MVFKRLVLPLPWTPSVADWPRLPSGCPSSGWKAIPGKHERARGLPLLLPGIPGEDMRYLEG